MENDRTEIRNDPVREGNQSKQGDPDGHEGAKREDATFPRSTEEGHLGDPPPETNFGEGGVGAKGGFVGNDRGVKDATDDPYATTDRTGTGLYNDVDDSTRDGLGGVSGSLGNRSDLSAQRSDGDNGRLGTTSSGERPLGEDSSEGEGPLTDEERLLAQGARSTYEGSGSSTHGGIEGIGAAMPDQAPSYDPEILGAGPQGRVQVTGATDPATMPGQPDFSGPDQGDAGDARREDSSGLRAQDHGQTDRDLTKDEDDRP